MKLDPSQNAPIIIVGMHRSGTSCLTGSLAQTDLQFGDVNRAAPHNKKGNYENYAIMELHEALLAANDGSWDNPPESVKWSDYHKKWRDQLIKSYPVDKTWGFKDPRTLLLLDGWLEALPNARLVGSFRHPIAVAKSLNTRNKFPFEKSFSMWMFYNLTLFKYISERGGELICFDHSPQVYRKHLTHMVNKLSLNLPDKGFDFFDQGLRVNNKNIPEEYPAEVAGLYQQLCELAMNGN